MYTSSNYSKISIWPWKRIYQLIGDLIPQRCGLCFIMFRIMWWKHQLTWRASYLLFVGDVLLAICPDNQSAYRGVPATSTGIIYSHSDIYTSNYGPDLNCTLIIYGFGNYATIDITVDTFATEKSDTLNIYGGNILQKSGNIERNTVWKAIASASGELWLKFETTSQVDDGFILDFKGKCINSCHLHKQVLHIAHEWHNYIHRIILREG